MWEPVTLAMPPKKRQQDTQPDQSEPPGKKINSNKSEKLKETENQKDQDQENKSVKDKCEADGKLKPAEPAASTTPEKTHTAEPKGTDSGTGEPSANKTVVPPVLPPVDDWGVTRADKFVKEVETYAGISVDGYEHSRKFRSQ